MSPVGPIEEGEIEFDYGGNEIKSFDDAHSYFEMVSLYIVISEKSFKEHTSNGNRFYFCGNGDWWEVSCLLGMGFPHDKYGYSLVAVEVTPENKIASVTSRWNTYAGDTGNFIADENLKSILGMDNYRNLFCKSAVKA